MSIIFPPRHNNRENARRMACLSNLKQIMLGLQQYVQDYNERFPIIATSPTHGWADALQPYVKATRLYQCPAENNEAQSSTDPTQPQYTDYWFNARLGRVAERKLSSPSQTITLGDGNDGTDATNARYHLLSLPKKWRADEKSPLFRHLDGANFAFADGHVKFISARSWKSDLDAGNGFTFRLAPKK
ncbi:MAG TPA: DUF1559 domain-containing protein [Abditibacterium sp.]